MNDEGVLISRVDTSAHADPASAKDSLELLCAYIDICGITPHPSVFELSNGQKIGLQEHRDLLMIWAQVNNIPRRLLRSRELSAAYRIVGRSASRNQHNSTTED